MSTVELRNIINEKLSFIDDMAFLNKIRNLIETKEQETIFKLDNFQKDRINKAREEFNLANTISHYDIEKDVNLWLNSK